MLKIETFIPRTRLPALQQFGDGLGHPVTSIPLEMGDRGQIQRPKDNSGLRIGPSQKPGNLPKGARIPYSCLFHAAYRFLDCQKTGTTQIQMV